MGAKLLDNIKAVGFDLDGTLYQSSSEMSEWISEQLIGEVVKKEEGDPTNVEKEYEKRRSELGSNTKTLDSFGLVGIDVFRDLWNRLPLDKFVKKSPELVDQLRELREKVKVFLISNGRGIEIRKKMEYLEIQPEWFDPFIACYDHDTVKPDPKSFLMVLDELQLKPEEVLFVGDRVATDIEGAREVGMKTMLVYGESAEADVSVATIEEGMELLLA